MWGERSPSITLSSSFLQLGLSSPSCPPPLPCLVREPEEEGKGSGEVRAWMECDRPLWCECLKWRVSARSHCPFSLLLGHKNSGREAETGPRGGRGGYSKATTLQ